MVHDGRAGERRGGAGGDGRRDWSLGFPSVDHRVRENGGRRMGGGCEDISSERGVRCRSSPAVIHNVTAIFLLQPLLQKKKQKKEKKKKTCTREPPRPG